MTCLRAILFSALIVLPITVLGDGGNAGPQQSQDARKEPAHVADTVAMEMEVEAFERGLTNQIGAWEKAEAKKSAAGHELLWMLGGCALLGMVMGIRYLPGLLVARDATFEARQAANTAAAQFSAETAAEEQAFSDFAAKFSIGPLTAHQDAPSTTDVPIKATHPEPPCPASPSKDDPLKTFFADASRSLNALRNLLQEMGRAPEGAQQLVVQAARETSALKAASELPELLPVWQ